MKQQQARVLFLSHGGGPLPLLGDEGHREMVENLKQIAGNIGTPSAIIVISAHWEEPIPMITSADPPALLYDYYGFPDESYSIEYPCPGSPELAGKIQQQLLAQGIESQQTATRGLDHGVFVPLKLMYPAADIPCVQLSLLDNLEPDLHIRMGNALSGLDVDNLLIIGSGFTFHNMRAFFAPDTDDTKNQNIAFEQWLIDTLSSRSIDEEQRRKQLIHWADAPGAQFCHPREEHLLPLHVCYGVAQQACSEYFELTILNKKASVYLW